MKIDKLNWEAPANNFEALVLALKLAIISPSKEKSNNCIQIAENIAEALTAEEIKRAKEKALTEIEAGSRFTSEKLINLPDETNGD